MNERSHSQRSARLVVASIATGVFVIGISATDFLPKKLIWNASASVPTGLYTIKNRSPIHGDLVLVRLPEWVQLIADQRGYLPSNVPVLKRVSALVGDRVCRFDRTVFVNGKVQATVFLTDSFAFKLPIWRGCVTLDEAEVFLLADHPKSFDGRYFGVTKLADVLGVAESVWTSSE